MKIISYTRSTDERAGILIGETVYDVESCSSFLGMEEMPTRLLCLLSAGRIPALNELHKKLTETLRDKQELPLQCWASLEEIKGLIQQAVAAKPERHHLQEGVFPTGRTMCQVGG